MKLKFNRWGTAIKFRYSNAYYLITGHKANVKSEYINNVSILER
jgi:hypothetical protein